MDGLIGVIGTNANNTITTDAAGGTLYAPINTVDPNAVGDTLTFGAGCANDPLLVLSSTAFLTFGQGDETVTTANIDGAIQINGNDRWAILDGRAGITVNIGSTGSININAVSTSRAIEAQSSTNGDIILNNQGTIVSNVAGNTATMLATGGAIIQNTGSITTSGAAGRVVVTSNSNIQVISNGAGAVIATSGDDADCLFAQANSIVIDSNLGQIKTTGNNTAASGSAIALNANQSVTVTYNNGTISTQGSAANCISAFSQGINLTTNDTNGVISTQGAGAIALTARQNIIIGTNNGQITTQGASSTGIITSMGSINMTTNGSTGVISTIGNNASAMTATIGAVTIGTNNGQITTQGTSSLAIHAGVGNVQITTNGSTGVISTVGAEADAIRTVSGNVIIGSNAGVIQAAGDLVGGNGAQAIQASGSVTITSNTGTIRTTGVGATGTSSHAIWSQSGNISVGNGAGGIISTAGEQAYSLYAQNGEITVTGNSGSIATTSTLAGANSHAIFAQNNITIDNNGNITTQGSLANAILSNAGVIDINTNGALGQISAAGNDADAIQAAAGSINIDSNSGFIQAAGDLVSGNGAQAIQASGNVTIGTNTGTIRTTGVGAVGTSSHAIWSQGGTINITSNGISGVISTVGESAQALFAQGNITIGDLIGGTGGNLGNITTTGSSAGAIFATAGAVSIVTNDGNITTTGADAGAIFAGLGDVSITTNDTNGVISTQTASSVAISAQEDVIIGANNGQITTQGMNADAIFAGLGDVSITTNGMGGVISTQGANASAVSAQEDVIIGTNDGQIITQGDHAHAISSATGDINITTSGATGVTSALGDDADAIHAANGVVNIGSSAGLIQAGGDLVTDDGAQAIYASGDVTIGDNTGTIQTTGVGTLGTDSYAVWSETGNIDITSNGASGVIATAGDGAIALFAQGNITIGDLIGETGGNLGDITTTGANAAAIFATAGAVSIVTNDGNITTTGADAGAIFAGLGDVSITTNDTNGVIATQGVNSSAVSAQEDVIIDTNNGEISTQGVNSDAIFANTGSVQITTNGATGVISTVGDNSPALFAAVDVILGTNDGQITTQGDHAHAISSATGDINITTSGATGVTSALGDDADAIHAANGVVNIGSSAGLIQAGGDLVIDDGAQAIYALGDITIGANTGSIQTTGIGALGTSSHAIWSQTGNVEITSNGVGGAIRTAGDFAEGISAAIGIELSANDGLVSTMGEEAHALHTIGGDILIGPSSATASITTTGGGAKAIWAENGTVTMDTQDGVIGTTGGISGSSATADAIWAANGVTLAGNSGSMATTGDGARAIYAASGDIILSTNSGSMTTQGMAAHAIEATNGNITIASNSGTISTAGTGAHAIAAPAGSITLTNESSGVIATTGNDTRNILSGSGATILNYGQIIAQGLGNSQAIEVSGGPAIIQNLGGTISTLSTNTAIQTGASDDVLVFEGGLVSSAGTYAIHTGDGDDTVTLRNIDPMNVTQIQGTIHGGAHITGDTLIFDFVGFCADNLGSSGSVTHWGQTYTWEDFENLVYNSCGAPAPVGVAFQNWAITYNQQQIGKTFDNIISMPEPELLEFIEMITNAGQSNFPAIANQLSPQRYEVLSKLAFNNHDFLMKQFDNRSSLLRENNTDLWDTSGFSFLDNTLDPKFEQMNAMLTASKNMPVGSIARVRAPEVNPMNDQKFGCFLSGNVIMAEGDATLDIFDYEWNSYGAVVGADYKLFPCLAVGIIGSYNHSDVDLDTFGSSANVENYTAGIYTNAWWQNFYLNSMLSYGFNKYEGNREVPFVRHNHHFDTTGNQFNLGANTGYDFHLKSFTIGPTGGVRYVNFNRNGFTEAGDGVDQLILADDDANSLRTSAGIKGTYTLHTQSISITSELRSSWGHEFLDDSRGITARFNSDQLHPFTIKTTDPERDWAELGASVRAKFNDTVSAFIDYDTQVGQDDFFAHSVNGGLRLEF